MGELLEWLFVYNTGFVILMVILMIECFVALVVSWQESGRHPADRRGLYPPLPPTAPISGARARARSR